MRNSIISHREKTMINNQLLAQNKIVIDYTEYLNQADLRKDLPKYIQEKIRSCVEHILSLYPETEEISLIGSYSDGTYIDENTSEKFKQLKKQIIGKIKISDFDFELLPLKYDFFTSKDGRKIHLGKDRNNHKIKVYSNGDYKV